MELKLISNFIKNGLMKYLAIILIAALCCVSTITPLNSDFISVPIALQHKDSLNIYPIEHATFVLTFEDEVIYVDPTGGKEAFANYKKPTLILITDIHGDHFNLATLKELDVTDARFVVPQAVANKIPNDLTKNITVLNNNEEAKFRGTNIEAIPMYNLRDEASKFHPKGRGNGYVLTINDERIYISGDTEDIPEMRNLKQIDKAFVCMNLPYTMPVAKAADAVLDFKPKKVYPYHYRGKNGLSDIEEFTKIVKTGNSSIQVIKLDWY